MLYLAATASSSMHSVGISPKKNKSAVTAHIDHGPRKGVNYSISAFDVGTQPFVLF